MPSNASPTPPPLPKRKWGKGIQYVLATILLLFSLVLLVWRIHPNMPYQWVTNKMAANEQEQTIARPTSTDFTAYRPLTDRAPSIMAVDPKDMYQAFLYQYCLRPDTRFIKTFEILAERFGEYFSGQPGQNPYRMGEVLSNGKEIVVPLLKKGQAVAEIKVPLPMTFLQAMVAFNEWIVAMEKGSEQLKATTSKASLWQELKNAEGNINMVDPRAIITGLTQLEGLRQEAGPDVKILQAATRGYAMLLMVLYPDKMDYADSLAAYGLSFLALAKRLDPTVPLIREEALLAMNMGYTAYASKLLQSSLEASPNPIDKTFDAFMRQDLAALKGLQGEGSRVLGYYLLARLYRDMGLHREAEQVATELLNRFPGLYPIVVQIIYSGHLSIAKILTVIYPLDILSSLEGAVSPKSLRDEKTWQERVKGFAGEKSESNISLTRFESLLAKWQPMEQKQKHGLIIDEERIKTIFRILYTDAVFLRFNVLLNRWNVVERAATYAQSLAGEDKDHPLVMEMLAEIDAEIGRRKEADAMCERVINYPTVPGGIAKSAFYHVDDALSKTKLAPAVAHTLDGRPKNLFSMGTIFERLWYYDLAEQYYSLAIEQNPYFYNIYTYLAQVTGNEEPLSLALAQFPYSFTIMEEAGDYFAEKDDLASKKKALEYYDMALKLVPTMTSLPEKKAGLLRKLKRYPEAAHILTKWIEEHGQNDITTTLYKAQLAQTYLEIGNPQMALQIIADEIESYQAGAMMTGAKVYEALRQTKQAEDIYRRAVERYPTASHVLAGTATFFWRQGRNEEAATMIAQARKSMGQFSQWYFMDFLEVFAQAPENRIMNAIDSLIKHGATPWEVSSLGFRFHWKKRSEIAHMMMQKAAASQGNTMERLETNVSIYQVLKDWKGEKEALEYLHKAVPGEMRGPLTMVLYKQGLFGPILMELENPDAFPPLYREYVWLQRLIAWLALGKENNELANQIRDHYNQNWLQRQVASLSDKETSNYYYDIGRYLLGMISRDELLAMLKTLKQRCEFSYYVGLSERLKNNFTEAAYWYHVCQETLLQNNGEFHWASEEVFWWAHMGTKNRHRLVGDDIEIYNNKKLSMIHSSL